jgi:hypothetical protein
MALQPGTRLGPYEILAALGSGGAPAAMRRCLEEDRKQRIERN